MPIYSLTTEGPVKIQRITVESATVRCAVCVDGLAKSLPISAAYDDFVRSPTGVIERLTGHAAYRIDVDKAIDGGRSWQLSFFLAHLASPNSPTMHVFATGEVDRDLVVRDVDHLDRKLAALARYLDQNRISRDDVIVILPADKEQSGQLSNLGKVVYVKDTAEAARAANIEVSGSNPISRHKELNSINGVRRGRAALISAILICFVLAGWLSAAPLQWKSLADTGQLLALEQTLTEAQDSLAYRFQAEVFTKWLRSSAVRSEHVALEESVYAGRLGCTADLVPIPKIGSGTRVCVVRWQAFADQPGIAITGRVALWPQGLGVDRAETVKRGSAQPNGRIWELAQSNGIRKSDVIRLVVLVGGSVPKGPQPWYADLLRAPLNSVSFRAAEARLAGLGFIVIARDWRFD